MNTKQLISFAKEIEILQDLNEDELKIITPHFITKEFQSKTVIFEENARREFIHLIYSGRIGLYKKDAFDQEVKLATFEKNDFLGEAALIDKDAAHSTTAKAETEAVIVMINIADFSETVREKPEIELKMVSRIAKVISQRMSHSNARAVNIASEYTSARTRTEHDLLGDRKVREDCYYGVQTLRAIENFNISGVPLNFHPLLIEGLVMVKKAAAKANFELDLLSQEVADGIDMACDEILNGKWRQYFVVDMIQGGAGTSTNMNANEVIANRALEIMGYHKGEYDFCHPNNHVNLSQSTNDAYPTGIKIALIMSNKTLVKVLIDLSRTFRDKAAEFANTIKMGRTQLQDAVPMTLGQEFEAYAATLEEEIKRLTNNANLFLEINMGATAIGTGINSDPRYSHKVLGHLREITGLDLVLAPNLVEATPDTGAFIMYSSAIKRLAIKLSKISNDLRLLSSGPRCGFNEINLPPMQPGSSIMPGKVNPVIPEVVNQIAFKVIGNDLTVNLAAEAGQLELNVMEPVIVQSLFENIEMLKNGMTTLMHRCVEGITANDEHCRQMVLNSIGIVTALNPVIGYEASTKVAKEALETNRSVYELVLEQRILSKEEIDEILSPENMIKPQFYKKKDA